MGVRAPRRQSCVADCGVHKSGWPSEIIQFFLGGGWGRDGGE